MSATMPNTVIRHIHIPTDEEDAAIRAGIAADPDARELDDDWFARARPARDVLPGALYAALTDKTNPVKCVPVTDAEHAARVETLRKRGRPPSDNPKVPVHIRLSADVLAAFKATGSGWQARIDALLREAVAAGRV